MTDTERAIKGCAKISLGALVVLLIGSIVFYKERMLFSDASFISFNIVNFQSLQIQEARYGSFITQLWPYLGQKMGLSLHSILLGYSIAFNAFYLAIASVLYFVYKNYRLTVLMVLYYTLFISQSYYWTNNELHQAICWMFLFYGTLLHMGKKHAQMIFVIPVFILLLLLTISTHFVVIIPFIFLWVYYWVEQNNWPFSTRNSIVLSALIAVAVLLKYLDGTRHSYESEHLHNVTHANIADGLHAFVAPVTQMFLLRCLTNYWWGALIFIAGMVALARTKRIALLVWSLLILIGYIVVIGLTYGDYDKSFPLFHIESEWAGISIVTATPFVFSLLPRIKARWAMALLAAVFITRLIYIQSYAADFTWRINFEQKVLARMKEKGIKKLALYEEKELRKKLILEWALPQETLFLSTISGDKPGYTFTLLNPDNKEAINWMAGKRNFYTVFGPWEQASLNARYFSIDTTNPYIIMSYSDLMK